MWNIQSSISEIVRQNYRTADVFKRHGINYCCGGNASLKDTCALRQLNLHEIKAELDDAVTVIEIPLTVGFQQWPLSFLLDYIEHVHHAYIKKTAPALSNALQSFASGHIAKYPYMQNVATIFRLLTNLLQLQLQKKEESIFPYMRQVLAAGKRRQEYKPLLVKTISRPLQVITQVEHKRIEEHLQQLLDVTDHYHFQPQVCTNHQVLYHKLKEFDQQIQQYLLMNDDILFPQIMTLEKEQLYI